MLEKRIIRKIESLDATEAQVDASRKEVELKASAEPATSSIDEYEL